MIKNNKKTGIDTINTIIGNGINLESSKITGTESVRIDGNYKGDIDIDGNLIVGETGSITGNIKVKYLLVAGKIDGNVSCGTVVHAAATARIAGNIETNSIIIDDGAQFDGNCHMLKNNKPALETAAPKKNPEKAAK